MEIAECLSVCVEFFSANLALIRTNKFCTFLFSYDIYTFRELIFAGIKFCGCLGTFLNFARIKFRGKANEVNFVGI